jgi:hypothetical protein
MLDDNVAWPLAHVYMHDTTDTFQHPAYVGGAAAAANPGDSQSGEVDRGRVI